MSHGDLFFLREIHIELHVIEGTGLGQEKIDDVLEPAAMAEGQMGKNRLESGHIGRVGGLAQEVMEQGGAAPPESDNKNRGLLNANPRYPFFPANGFPCPERLQYQGHDKRQIELEPVFTVYLVSPCKAVEVACGTTNKGGHRKGEFLV